MSRRARRCLTLALLAAMVAGCWDVRELNQLALVMAVGVDEAETPGRYQVTVQIARPGDTKEGKSGGAQGQSPVFTASADGDTIFAAIRNLAQFTSRRIMWAHNNVVVIGESLAKDDITPVIDFFTRNQELRMRTWMVVARGADASSIVAAKTGMEDVPADSISALFRYAHLPGETVRTDVSTVAAAFFSPELEPVIAAMRLTQRVIPPADQQGEHGGGLQAELRGTAVFARHRLAGYLDQEAGRGLLWLRGEMGNAVVTLPCPGASGRHMAVEIRAPKVRVRADAGGAVPRFSVAVHTQGILSEQDCPTPAMGTKELKAYAEAELARKVEASIREALGRLQQDLRVDGAEFGRRLHIDHPGWWRQHRERWPEVFPRVETQVAVRADIPMMGIYTRPLHRPSR